MSSPMTWFAVNRKLPTHAIAPAVSMSWSAIQPMTDAQIVARVLAGDVNAFETLVESHQSRVYYFALRMLGNEQEAQDAAQDAFVQAYAKLKTYDSQRPFKTWIMTITSNLCIDRLRRRKIEPTAFTELVPLDTPEYEPSDYFESHEPSAQEIVEDKDQHAAVTRMLNGLPSEDRSIVLMHYWNDMSYEDIAATFKTSVGAIKSRLFRARRMMAQSQFAKQLA